MSRVALLMTDNRPATLLSPSAHTLTYPALSFALNALYACAHGYDLLYHQMTAPTCSHATQGARNASYCKLPAIARALRAATHPTVAFIDSDSFFLHRNVSLPSLLATFAPPASSGAAVWFANDLPQLGERPNGGFHVWSATAAARRLLAAWWHLPGGRYNGAHDYEQHALQWLLSQLSEAVPLIGTLQLRAMADEFTHPVAHIDHTKAERRLWVMGVEFIAAALETQGDALSRGARRRLRALLAEARAAPLDAKETLHGGALRERVLRAAADLLLKASSRDGGGVVAAAAAAALGEGVGSPRGLAVDGAAVGCAAGRGSLRVVRYDASAEALRSLPLHSAARRLSPEGMPLQLLPCAAGADGRRGVFQRWREARGEWSVAAAPQLCLKAGPRRAPKKPYPLLAQLRRCARRAADGVFSSRSDASPRYLQLEAGLASLQPAVAAAAAAVRRGASPRANGRRLAGGAARRGKARRLGGRRGRPADGKGKRPFWQDGTVPSATPLCLSGKGEAAIFVTCGKAAYPLQMLAEADGAARQLQFEVVGKAGRSTGEYRCLSALLGPENGLE
ncbi:hypothetical protein AB1Y20_006234 [Prymnesium parvum]|uniref:Nucleotide-diphospho-sugar transferase domain-containing protein n=1 Tax=Prymnesium parvum TaxID=97485 RepID=A0AB34J416_PRYPA